MVQGKKTVPSFQDCLQLFDGREKGGHLGPADPKSVEEGRWGKKTVPHRWEWGGRFRGSNSRRRKS